MISDKKGSIVLIKRLISNKSVTSHCALLLYKTQRIRYTKLANIEFYKRGLKNGYKLQRTC